MNSLRYPEIPAHFETEALKLTKETDYWQLWIERRGSSQEQDIAFQHWLNGAFGGQPDEDADANMIAGSEVPPGERRRDVLAWNLLRGDPPRVGGRAGAVDTAGSNRRTSAAASPRTLISSKATA